jgi:putative DNA methylase
VEITEEMVAERPDLKPYLGEKLTVIAWLWARTVKSPNPAFSHIDVPLASTFILSSKEGKEAYVQPVIEKDGYRFTVKVGKPPAEAKAGTSVGKRKAFRCLVSQTPIGYDFIRKESQAHRIDVRLMAIIAESKNNRFFLSPTSEQQDSAKKISLDGSDAAIQVPIARDPWPMTCLLYGLNRFDQLFTRRQLKILLTLSDLIIDIRTRIQHDANRSTSRVDSRMINGAGCDASSYADAVSLYLAFAADKCADYGCTIATWMPRGTVGHAFSKQAISMTWDFPEPNLLSDVHCGWSEATEWVASAIENIANDGFGQVRQLSASNQKMSARQFVSTDPPYYDNIGYADLSDFFYVWLRRSLRDVYPDLFSTVSTPKSDEIVAAAYRHENEDAAKRFFLDSMTTAMSSLTFQAHPSAPITIYYAFKQSDTDNTNDHSQETNSTGWETFLDAVLRSGLAITGTWPVRTERSGRSRDIGSNALASSIVLVCRPRSKTNTTIGRRQFVRLLNETLPLALDAMTRASEGEHSPVAPVDLSQAIIGPGMAIFSRYDAVLEADGTPMSVKTALQLINRFLAEDDFDADTQFCLHWFEQYGWEAGKFGEADTLARAKGTSVDGVKQAGVIEAGGGHVRLLRWREYDKSWDPTGDARIPIWQVLHQMILAFQAEGDSGAGKIYAALAAKTEAARQLAYRLYTLCERKSWAEDARAFNDVVAGWSGIESAALHVKGPVQRTLFGDDAGR